MNQKSKNAMVALVMGLTALSAHAQRDKNYYTQVVHLADGSEVRLLPDEIERMNVIKADDWQQMTIAEYLKYNTSLGADSVNAYVQGGWRNEVLNNENATSTFWAPNNKAWAEEKQRRSPYYNSVGTISYYRYDTSLQTLSMPCGDLISKSILEMGLATPIPSSVLSRQTVLNGEVAMVDEVSQEFVKELSHGATSENFVLRMLTGVRHDVVANDGTPYVWAEPTGGYSKPEVDVRLPQPLSTTYDIYCVIVPENPDYVSAVTTARPNRIIFELCYSDVDGNMKTHTFLDESEENINSFKEQFPNVADNTTNRTTIRAFSNDPTKVDTLYVGRFAMPVCYEGLPEEVTPVLMISSPFSVFNSTLRDAYARDIRLAAVIMRPVELENKQ